MRHRIAGVMGVMALAVALVAGSASAQDQVEVHAFSSGWGDALRITLFGEEASFSSTDATVVIDGEDVAANANAWAILSPIVSEGVAATAPDGEALNESCGTELDPAEIFGDPRAGLFVLEVGCVRAETSLDPLFADGMAESVFLDLSLAPVAGGDLDPILEPLREGISQLIGGLDPILEPVGEQLEIDFENLIDDILDQLLAGEPFLRITAGTSNSGAFGDDASLTGYSGHEGFDIEIFPEFAGGDEPLLIIGAGEAYAEAAVDLATGEVTTSGTHALIGEPVPGDALGAIGDGLNQIVDGLGEISAASLPCNPDDNPLYDLVCIELGSSGELTASELEGLGFGETAGGFRAVAAQLQVLPLLEEQVGGPGVGIALADSWAVAEASIAAVPPPPPPPTEPPATDPPPPPVTDPPPTAAPTSVAPAPPPPPAEQPRTTLPRTGADVPVGAAAALAGLAVLGLVAVRRTGTSSR
jgi:hypothetical protein